ncbi:MAG TPA: hypothetical protein VE960_03745, partial [bacterium]|nr:hypothetical protein [bacterium]
WDSDGNHGQSNEMPVHCRWRRFIRDGNEIWGGDIDFVYVRSTETLLEFRVGINGHWNDPHDPDYGIDIGILLDVDQDQSTGLNEYTPGWYPPNDIGADFGASVGWEGDALWIWNEADKLWVVHGDYAYTSIPNSGSRFDVGIYRADIGNPSAVDVVAVGAAVSFDWAPDTGHATYLMAGLYVGRDTTLPYVPERALPPEETQGGLLWQCISPG